MEGISPGQESLDSGVKTNSVTYGGRSRIRKEFLHRFVDSEILTGKLEGWFEELLKHPESEIFEVPFKLAELKRFDYALAGVPFQQLVRMPSSVYASTSDAMEATAYLAMEDFLHASVKGLWDAFWSEGEGQPLPFSAACVYNNENNKFYHAEKAIAKGKLEGLCATAIFQKNSRHPHGRWDEVLELALLRPEIGNLASENSWLPCLPILGEALYFAIRILLSRSISRTSVHLCSSPVFILLVDSQYGGVVKVEGDLNKLEFNVNNVYECAADWVKQHVRITVSPFDRIWNKLGNANWGDIGALQILYATFHSLTQFAGMPKQSIEGLAAHHDVRLQARILERQLGDAGVNGAALHLFQHQAGSQEIVEVQDGSKRMEQEELMKLEVGSVVWLEDSEGQKGYRINGARTDGELPYYVAAFVEDPGKALFLYVGSRPSQLEPAWEDMSLWYQVQRQTKVLTAMKHKGLSSKYLPQLSASGRIIHPGPCQRPDSGGKCDHPWCWTPILVTSPVGEPVTDMVRSGRFGPYEAIKCCHDSLSALASASSAGIQHGDIRPENVLCITSGVQYPYFILIGWGHAVMEERDRPTVVNLHFSSTSALQEGKLSSASDAESLVYMLYFCCYGESSELDSVESALRWRERYWSKRLIQQKLGDISAVLKAFADYVNSLCETPFPVDYGIWLRRLRRHIHEDENGKAAGTSGG